MAAPSFRIGVGASFFMAASMTSFNTRRALETIASCPRRLASCSAAGHHADFIQDLTVDSGTLSFEAISSLVKPNQRILAARSCSSVYSMSILTQPSGSFPKTSQYTDVRVTVNPFIHVPRFVCLSSPNFPLDSGPKVCSPWSLRIRPSGSCKNRASSKRFPGRYAPRRPHVARVLHARGQRPLGTLLAWSPQGCASIFCHHDINVIAPETA